MEFTCNNIQGAYAESIFITECIKRKINIYQPVLDNHGVDFLVKTDKYRSIQIKSTNKPDNRYKTRNSFKITICRGFDSRKYQSTDFDFCFVYIIPFDIWYAIPIDEIKVRTIRVSIDSASCKYSPYKNAWHLLKSA